MESEPQDEEPSRRLAYEVHRRLEDMILSGALRAGEAMTERRLAKALDVSRTPLRDALLLLEGQGLLKRRNSRYLEVREMSVPEFIQVLNIRRLLEPEAARLGTGRIDAELVAGLRRRLELLLATARDGTAPADPDDSLDLDTALHEGIAQAAGNPMMAEMIRDLRRRTRIFDLGRMPDRFAAVCREHLAIVEALQAGDAEAASAAMTRHIDAVKAAVIQRLAAI